MLLTDWRRPGGSQSSYLPDPRAVHLWDNNRRLSAMLGGPAHLEGVSQWRRVSFRMKDAVWDAALVYPPGAVWGSRADLLLAPVANYRVDLINALVAGL